MKNKKTILILAISVIILAVLAGIYISGRNKLVNPEENKTQDNGVTETGPQNETDNIVSEKNQLVTDDFSMELPLGWSKTPDTAPGVLAIAANPNENISDAAAKNINFISYLAVSRDALQGKTMEEYLQSVKDELQTAISGAIFANEKDLTINERSARAVETEMTQQGVNFKVLIVAVKGDGDDVWVMSYNTVKSSWDGYKEDFSNSARSFILKK